MCGIVAVFGDVGEPVRDSCLAGLARLDHRGPDGAGACFVPGVAVLGHKRLAIMDPGGGQQPIAGPGGAVVVHNGEIYNWRQLRAGLEAGGRRFACASDSEVIAHLYEAMGPAFVGLLDGDFAFAALLAGEWIAARDPLGVKPLYYGGDAAGRMWFASEVKALHGRCDWFEPFPPGHLYTSAGGLQRYYRPQWMTQPCAGADGTGLRERFEAAVGKRLMSDVPLGSLLSGGLDSSLVTAIAARFLREGGARLPTFSVGIDPQSPDLRMARAVAAHAGTDHHETVFDPREGIGRLSEIIYHLESYDVSLVRGSVPMYFMMADVRSRGIKVVLAGDGSDEVFGGYLYLYSAPSTGEFWQENLSLLSEIHLTELPTLDKLTMQHSVEARVPFLDTDLLEIAMAVDPEIKRPVAPGGDGPGRIEKFLIRAAFDDPADQVLPPEVLWRQKEAFEDGVGYQWIDLLRLHAEEAVSDRDFARSAERFPFCTPPTKEAYLYRVLFSEHFPGDDAARCVGWWQTRWQSDPDPSGRAIGVHQHAL